MLSVSLLRVPRFGALRPGERVTRMMFGFHRRQSGARVFLGVEMLFRTRDRRLCGIQIR